MASPENLGLLVLGAERPVPAEEPSSGVKVEYTPFALLLQQILSSAVLLPSMA
jgi:hypothetical protein